MGTYIQVNTLRRIAPKWLLYWGIPLLSVISILIASQLGAQAVWQYIVSPFGFSENIPTVFLAIAVGYGIAVLRLPGVAQYDAPHSYFKAWIVIFIIACVFFAGEDQNWFQYWLDRDVPEWFIENNKEHETNLHNINGWFNQKPRLMTEIWSWVACILVPLGWSWPRKVTKSFVPEVFWPDRRVLVLGVLSVGSGILNRFDKNFNHPFENFFTGARTSELQEIFYAYLMMLFMALLYYRLRDAKAAKPKKARKA